MFTGVWKIHNKVKALSLAVQALMQKLVSKRNKFIVFQIKSCPLGLPSGSLSQRNNFSLISKLIYEDSRGTALT
jgi:hypothetical protein